MNNKRKIFIGSRKSNLAKQQTALALKKLYSAGLKNIFPKHIISLGDKASFNEFKNHNYSKIRNYYLLIIHFFFLVQ